MTRSGTTRISMNDLDKLSNSFFPTKLQPEIKKKYEIRTFYFIGQTYSIAIMSQENEETKLDFRDYSVFTRVQKCALPESIEKKISLLMSYLDLKMGVIDFIIDEDDNYIFLEINPTGQIMRISEYGNYNLDYIIANYLNLWVNG